MRGDGNVTAMTTMTAMTAMTKAITKTTTTRRLLRRDDYYDDDDNDDGGDYVREVHDNTRNGDDVALVCTRRSSTRNWHLPVETRRGRAEGER